MYIRKQRNQEIYNIHHPSGEIISSHSSRRSAKQVLRQQLKGGYIGSAYNAYDAYKTFSQGREMGLPPYSRDTLKKYGSHRVVNAILFRRPIPSALTYALKLYVDRSSAADGRAINNKLFTTAYDKLFHLGIMLILDNGTIISVDKNQIINIKKIDKIETQSTRTGTEIQEVNLNNHIYTLDQVINNTRTRMGDQKFEVYNAFSSNCQDLILNLLEANYYGNKSDRDFVKQDLTELIRNIKFYPYFQSFLQGITDLARLGDIIVYGKGRKSNIK
jgi:hypothetical protein